MQVGGGGAATPPDDLSTTEANGLYIFGTLAQTANFSVVQHARAALRGFLHHWFHELQLKTRYSNDHRA